MYITVFIFQNICLESFKNHKNSINFNLMELTILIFLLNTLMVLGTEAINKGNVTYKNKGKSESKPESYNCN